MFGWFKRKQAAGPFAFFLPAVPPQGGRGGRGAIAFTSSADSFEKVLAEVLARFPENDTKESLTERAKVAWENRKSVGDGL